MAHKTGDNHDNDIFGTNSDDVIKGLGGDDVLNGATGKDRIYGGDGLDEINGSTGDDKTYGEGGNDIMIVSTGNDFIDGGEGINVLNFRYAGQGVHVSLANHVVTYHDATGDGVTHFTNVEILQGSSHNDELIGDVNRNMLRGAEGNDILMGVDGDDYLFGGIGHETMTGGRGKDGFLFGAETTADNFDKVKDFNDKDDWLAFDHLIFKDLEGHGASEEYATIVTRAIDESQFQAGKGHEAASGDVRIIYDSGDGVLYYDTNGDKAGGLSEIADLGKGLHLTVADVFVF